MVGSVAAMPGRIAPVRRQDALPHGGLRHRSEGLGPSQNHCVTWVYPMRRRQALPSFALQRGARSLQKARQRARAKGAIQGWTRRGRDGDGTVLSRGTGRGRDGDGTEVQERRGEERRKRTPWAPTGGRRRRRDDLRKMKEVSVLMGQGMTLAEAN